MAGNCAERLVDCFGGRQNRGSVSEAARAMQVDRSLLSLWLSRGYIPLHHAQAVQEVTKARITAAEILEETTRLNPRKLRRVVSA